MLMPPDSVPILPKTRLLETSRLCVQACEKMPPPPCELSVTVKPSIRDGLHWKLLGYGSGPVLVPQSEVVSNSVPVGKVSLPNGSDPAGNFTPFPSTVIPAPS